MTQVEALLILARHLLVRALRAYRLLTVPERVAFGIAGAHVGLLAGVAVNLGGLTHWFAVVGACSLTVLLVTVVADAVIMRVHGKRLNATMIKLHAVKPTGAPRVAEVNCIHGDAHRFVYGMQGWEPAGPAVEHRPTTEETTAP